MPGSLLRRLLKAERAAVAPTIGLSLFALIGVGGIAFDYARLAAMDSELQNAADQAALAAASQLDGELNAITRATNAAQTLIANDTRFANDGAGTAIAVPTLVFYDGYDQADESFGDVTSDDAEATTVQITVAGREAFYALTPVVGALRSGNISASAVAGVGSAICKVPPVMICNPQETSTNTSFDVSALIGKGLKLLAVGNGGGAWAPGNFGYLDTHSTLTNNPVLALKQALGWNTPPGDCQPITGVDTKTGANTPVTDAINTRFDIFDQGGPGGDSCPSGGVCQPSINSVKDLVRRATATGQNNCGIGPNGWGEPDHPYLPSSAVTPLTGTEIANTQTMGHPRDMCHAVSSSGTCSQGRIGDGVWDKNAYFSVNYPGFNWQAAMTAEYGTTTVTRYQVYLWEIEHADDVFTPPSGPDRTIKESRVAMGSGANAREDHNRPICSASGGITPSPTIVDRRRISMAVINCMANNVNGNSQNVPVELWVDAFIVEPSANRTRTGQQDVYVEVIEENGLGGIGSTAGQVVERTVPYLIR